MKNKEGGRGMYSIKLTLPPDMEEPDVETLSGALYDISEAVVARREDNKRTNPWILEWITGKKPEREDLTARMMLVSTIENLPGLSIRANDWDISEIENQDWLAQSYEGFQPFSIGPFYIHGSHYEGEAPEGQMPLQIDAATAFGSGEHETTEGCMQAMLKLKDQGVCPWNVLDVGTGSGILAIAAWKLWKTPIMATDIEEEAIRVTRRHMEANGVREDASALSCSVGPGFQAPSVKDKAPFDLIIANILAGPVIEMADDLCAALDDNGFAVLSGMLQEQSDHVLSVYEANNLTLKNRYDIGEWSTLVLQKIV